MSDELIVYTFEQNSPEWLEARRGIVTASEFDTVQAQGRTKGSESVTRRKYLLTLVGEILTGELAPGWEGNKHTERGHLLEPEARELYAMVQGVEPQQVGFMRCGRVGASPDSLVGEDGLLEIKTKLPHLQLDVLDRDRLPPEHVAQVQGQLWVSGRAWCDFVSYWPGLPIFIKRVHRDEEYIAALAESVKVFVSEMDAWVARFSAKGA